MESTSDVSGLLLGEKFQHFCIASVTRLVFAVEYKVEILLISGLIPLTIASGNKSGDMSHGESLLLSIS